VGTAAPYIAAARTTTCAGGDMQRATVSDVAPSCEQEGITEPVAA
jgi:hypothetical protein